jgi:protease I
MTLETKTIAILTANGVNQNDISQVQRALIQQRNFPKIIGAGAKLIQSWNETEWGHNFAMDVSITEALGVDYDILIIPGGERAMTVLQSTAHTQRILNSFVAAGKPVLFMNSSQTLIEVNGLDKDASNFKIVEDVNEETLPEMMEWFASADIQDTSEKQAA